MTLLSVTKHYRFNAPELWRCAKVELTIAYPGSILVESHSPDYVMARVNIAAITRVLDPLLGGYHEDGRVTFIGGKIDYYDSLPTCSILESVLKREIPTLTKEGESSSIDAIIFGNFVDHLSKAQLDTPTLKELVKR